MTLAQQLQEACAANDDVALKALAKQLGFAEAAKSATNLRLLFEFIGDCALLEQIATDALATADSDLCLNNLERLFDTVDKAGLIAALSDETRRRQLLTVVGASAFLTGILYRKAAYFAGLISQGGIDQPRDEEAMERELRSLIPDEADYPTLQRQEILRIGSRDLCGLATLQEVTAELADLAAATLQRAYEVCSQQLQAEYGVPMVDDGDGNLVPATFTILGMGKLGGRELNFSSDIDLIYFYSSEKGETSGVTNARGEAGNRIPIHNYYVKLGEMLTKAIGQATEDGFVFRVDLRLRPEGNSGEMVLPLESGILYYESWGQSWERAALIKARPVAGDIALGEAMLKELEPFIFRRHLDYAMLEDIKSMKQKIDHNLARLREGETNLKLGRGGIREIEFFIQALQLINAGKKSTLRSKRSLEALNQLHGEGLVRDDELKILREAYIFLRTIEHRIQVYQEQQTHNLPARPEQLKALARRSGFADTPQFLAELERHRSAVSAIFRQLFYSSDEEIQNEVRDDVASLFDPTADPEKIKELLTERGFSNPTAAYDSLMVLRSGVPHSHLTQRARRHMERIAPLLLQEVIDSPEPDMALTNLERFFAALRARGTYFALLAENHQTMKLLVSLFGTSQFLTRIFIKHPEILDTLVSGSYAVPFKDLDAMQRDLTALLVEATDYERELEVIRRYRNEEFLRIALNDIYGHTPQGQKTYQLACLADCCLLAAVEIARHELIPRFGLPFAAGADGATEPAEFCILGMGKLGGMELNYHSDLDLIFVYEGEGETQPVDGTDPERFRPQGNAQYFSRLAQRIISVLTLVTQDGAVYQIDTRLRPSGNQGPLVTSLAAFSDYHETSAQLWERQALIKTRVINTGSRLATTLAQVIEQRTYEVALPENTASEIVRLRERMEKEIAREGRDHFNIKTGRGGMVDVEFIAQYLQLLHGAGRPALHQPNTLLALQKLQQEGMLDENDCRVLVSGYKFLRRLENMLRLIHDQSISELSNDPDYLNKLARRLGYNSTDRPEHDQLLDDYRSITENIRSVFSRLLPSLPETEVAPVQGN